jgi:hypothetical protein
VDWAPEATSSNHLSNVHNTRTMAATSDPNARHWHF